MDVRMGLEKEFIGLNREDGGCWKVRDGWNWVWREKGYVENGREGREKGKNEGKLKIFLYKIIRKDRMWS